MVCEREIPSDSQHDPYPEMSPKVNRLIIVVVVCLAALSPAKSETLPTFEADPPQNHKQLWDGIDVTSEPLDTEVLHAWEEDGVVLQVVRFRVGVFKGQKAMVAAVFGYPKGQTNLPGLVNIHGGGQYADYRAPLTCARRGYAAITIAWAGRISAPEYRVSPREVNLFWQKKTDDPNYRITTDWGPLDAYHAPSKNGRDAFVSIPDGNQEWTFDDRPSPRNNSWFLCTLAARRALTFLQQQPMVDPDRLGVYGHSMGGKLTVLTAGSDQRVKAAAPSCGGISDRYNLNPLHRRTVGDSPSLKNIACPTVFLSPSNDFHGHINDLVTATAELQREWRVTCSPHLNHVDLPAFEVATQLWFDQHLKGSFSWPKTPETKLDLETDKGTPRFVVWPDQTREVLDVEIFYTQQGRLGGDRTARENRIARFWQFAKPTRDGNAWSAELPVFSSALPLWVYANVKYPLDEAIAGAGYYYGDYQSKQFNVSSLIRLVKAQDLKSAGVKGTLQPTTTIEDFRGDWRKDWFNRFANDWAIRTHKVYHPCWFAPQEASLVLEVRSKQANKLVIGIDDFAAEVNVPAGDLWHRVELASSDFKDADNQPLRSWKGIKELRLLQSEHLRSRERGSKERRLVGGAWKGDAPEFRNVRWKPDSGVK